ncbi:alpha/beta fold hydrolase [Flavobacterium alkalisoli]|uniref:alpha/beta fold hydrolase n=1 Tax=Flavobacterium alkalisoli TaxID=2602769 RepID=UPI003A9544D1
MKYIKTLLLLLFPIITHSQDIFEYEKQINNIENYKSVEITFLNNSKDFNISGSLITPNNDFDKIVIIIPGSGKDTRHSHFILAENLLENNIGVFRFDERGIGKSGGDYSELSKDLAEDLSITFTKLKNDNPYKKIGLIGHSLGGVATIKTIEQGCTPDFIVLIETPIIKNGAFIMNQIKMNYENIIPQVMQKDRTKNEVISFLDSLFNYIASDSLKSKKEIKRFIKKNSFSTKYIALLNDPFLMEMLQIDLEETVQNLTIPTLYLAGTKDKVINHQKETELLKSFRNKNIEIILYSGLNHWLTKRDSPVGTSLYLMDPEPLNKITSWVSSI